MHEDDMKEFFRYKMGNLDDDNNKDNKDNSTNLLYNIQRLLEKLVNKNKIVPYNSGPTNLPIAVTVQPTDVDNIFPANGGYTQIPVEDILERKPDILYLINNGPGTIFAVVLHDTTTSTQSEYQIFEGDRGTFYGVHELRIRTTTVDTEYIVTENEHVRPKDVSFLRGRPYVSETTVAIAGIPNTESIVTDPVQGLGRNAHTGYIINDGGGDLLITLSSDGITFTPTITVIPNQTIDLEKEDVYTIVIDATLNNTAYRLAVH